MDSQRRIIEEFVRTVGDGDAQLAALLVTEDFELHLVCGKVLRGREAVRWFAGQHGPGRTTPQLVGLRRSGRAEVTMDVRLERDGEPARVAGAIARLRAGRVASLRLMDAPAAGAPVDARTAIV